MLAISLLKVEHPPAVYLLPKAVSTLALVAYVAVLRILVVSIHPAHPPLPAAKLAPPH